MKKVNQVFLLVLVLFLAGMLAGCGAGVNANFPPAGSMTGQMAEKFTDFDSVETCQITSGWGEGLHVDYSIEVEQGSLELKVTGPGGRIVWQNVFQEDEQGRLDLPMMLGGEYNISMSGQRAGGGFALSWSVD